MAGERKFVWFNTKTEQDLYEEAQSIQFSTEVKRWLRQRIERRNSLQRGHEELTVDVSKLGDGK